MTEDNFIGLLYITSIEHWRGGIISCKYTKGKAVFQLNKSTHLKSTLDVIESKLHRLQSLESAEVIPPGKFHEHFLILQQQVEDIGEEIYCFLSANEKRIIIKAATNEQAQQAKCMVELNLGMLQQAVRRGNRKFASSYEIGSRPVASHSRYQVRSHPILNQIQVKYLEIRDCCFKLLSCKYCIYLAWYE